MSIQVDDKGVPLAENYKPSGLHKKMPDKDTAGNEADDTSNKGNIDLLTREELYTATEQLMLKGVYNIDTISSQLQILPKTAQAYKDVVIKRWETSGSKRNLQRAKGEAIARLENITRLIYNVLEGTQSSEIKLRSIKQLLEVHDRQLHIHGASVQKLEELPSAFVQGGDGGLSVQERKLLHSQRKQLADDFLEFIAKSGKQLKEKN